MADCISREAAIEIICGQCAFKDACDAGVEPRCSYYIRISQSPAAVVRPVVHGRWIPMTYIRELTENGWPNCRWEKAIEPDSVDGLMCSECGEIFDFADARNFCTQCGADMRPEGRTKE